MPINKQIASLERGVDILVATPGRLVDLIERRSCSLAEVEVTVLDEADHMADLGFLPVVRRLLDLTPAGGQRLLFSATLDGDVATLVENYLTSPSVHALSSAEASVDTMSHHLFRLPHETKFGVVAEIASRPGRSLLFVRTKHGAERLAKQLRGVGVAADALHGGRTQSQRNRALDAFKDGTVGAGGQLMSPPAVSTSTTSPLFCTWHAADRRTTCIAPAGRLAPGRAGSSSCSPRLPRSATSAPC